MAPPSPHLLLSTIFASVTYSLAAAPAPNGHFLRGAPHRDGLSLLQRWASPPHPHALELSGEELTTYIATGRLPEQVLAQLQSSPTPTNATSSASAEDRAKKEESTYEKKADKIIGDMKKYRTKLDSVRLQAEEAYTKISDQEKRLSTNFLNATKLVDGLIQKATREASRAEVQTMLERLKRIHYKQVGTLDRSATYWLELAEKEKEATRVAGARARLQNAEASSLGMSESVSVADMKKATAKEKAELDAWFHDYWAQLEESEKEALEKEALEDELKENEKEKEPCDGTVAAPSTVERKLVPAVPGQVIPNSFITMSDASVETRGAS